MKYLLVLACGFLFFSCQKNETVSDHTEPGIITIRNQHYILDWSDEFEYNGLPDSAKWDYETGFVRNNETQYYTYSRLENCNVHDGVLHITALNDSFENHPVTSASIETLHKKDLLYGLIEVRAKMPRLGNGTWPAIWTLGTNRSVVGWPKCGEIDIMEWVGRFPTVALGSLYTKAETSTNTAERHWPYIGPNTDFFTKQFHNYSIEWDSTQIKYFVDDINYVTYTKSDVGRDWEPVTKTQYLKLNLAIGGSIPPIGGGGDIDYTRFPFTFEIDYVRYYKRVE